MRLSRSLSFKNNKPIEDFEKVREYLSKIPAISQGGCGISAVAMFRWLVSNNFDENDINFVMGYKSLAEFADNSIAFCGDEDLPYACSHIGILIQYNNRDTIIDCKERWFFSNYIQSQVVNENAMVSSINQIGQWNGCFDREKYVPKIEKKLKIDLKDIKLN